MNKITVFLSDEAATLQFGAQLAQHLSSPSVLYLRGNLGAGKTTLVRGILRSWHYDGKVKSPTYTLVEPYQLDGQLIYHFDLYRLADPEELEFIGIQDYFGTSICLIEWPERGESFLHSPDLDCSLAIEKEGRRIELQACSEKGENILSVLNQERNV